MIAYSRGSQSLAGAASLKHRMPAVIGTFRIQPDIAQWVEQQPVTAVGRGFDSRFPTNCLSNSEPS